MQFILHKINTVLLHFAKCEVYFSNHRHTCECVKHERVISTILKQTTQAPALKYKNHVGKNSCLHNENF